jgi:hypothetical protein
MALDQGETLLELRLVAKQTSLEKILVKQTVAKQTSLEKILVKQTVLASLKCYVQLDFPTG